MSGTCLARLHKGHVGYLGLECTRDDPHDGQTPRGRHWELGGEWWTDEMAGAVPHEDIPSEVEETILEPFRSQLDEHWRVTLRRSDPDTWRVSSSRPGLDGRAVLGVVSAVPRDFDRLRLEEIAHHHVRAALQSWAEEIVRTAPPLGAHAGMRER